MLIAVFTSVFTRLLVVVELQPVLLSWVRALHAWPVGDEALASVGVKDINVRASAISSKSLFIFIYLILSNTKAMINWAIIAIIIPTTANIIADRALFKFSDLPSLITILKPETTIVITAAIPIR